jgi:hypothetical protein
VIPLIKNLFRKNKILIRIQVLLFRRNEIIFRKNELIFRKNEFSPVKKCGKCHLCIGAL